MEINEKIHGKKERYMWLFSTFNNFFVTAGSNLASKSPENDTNFGTYISRAKSELHEKPFNGGQILSNI